MVATKKGGRSPRVKKESADGQMGRTRATTGRRRTKRGVNATRGRNEKVSRDMPDAPVLDVDLSAPLSEPAAAEVRGMTRCVKGIADAIAAAWPDIARRHPELFRRVRALPDEPAEVDLASLVEVADLIHEVTAIELPVDAKSGSALGNREEVLRG